MKHKEEHKDLTLPLGDVSMNSDLGIYYIDMRPAVVHYTENIYNGSFDKNGVPMIQNLQGKQDYFPINIAQYGFIKHAEYLNNRDEKTFMVLRACVEKLMDLKSDHKGSYVWFHQYKEAKYGIPAPWASAMAQGEIISLLLRFYQLTDDSTYLDASNKAYQFLQIEEDEFRVRVRDQNGYLWFEEYPSTPPSYVLNGYLYTLFGLYDLYRVTGQQVVKADIDECIATLKANLHLFDSGYWSYYDLFKKELVRYYYQKNVHVPQMEVLHKLTNEPTFALYAKKWRRTLTPFHFFFVQIMYRVLPRWRKIFKNKQ